MDIDEPNLRVGGAADGNMLSPTQADDDVPSVTDNS
jgi:hypothetical protein